MSRIATIATILALAAAPCAFAGSGTQNINDIGKQQPAPASVDLRSPDAVTPMRTTVAGQDLRAPDSVDRFVSSASAPRAATIHAGSLAWWAYLAIVAAAIVACALLVAMLRHAFGVGRPVGA